LGASWHLALVGRQLQQHRVELREPRFDLRREIVASPPSAARAHLAVSTGDSSTRRAVAAASGLRATCQHLVDRALVSLLSSAMRARPAIASGR